MSPPQSQNTSSSTFIMLNIVGHRSIYLGIAALLVGAAFASIAIFGLTEGNYF